jgi:hypothetical protein
MTAPVYKHGRLFQTPGLATWGWLTEKIMLMTTLDMFLIFGTLHVGVIAMLGFHKGHFKIRKEILVSQPVSYITISKRNLETEAIT